MGKVAILARVKENGAYPFYDPVWKNHKLIGGAVLKNGIETAYPNITYYFRFHGPIIGKQVTQNVGRNAADVLAQFVALCGKLDNPQESVVTSAPAEKSTG
jgi:hypothetical protein